MADPPPPGVPAEYSQYVQLMYDIQKSTTGDSTKLGLFFRVDEKVGEGTYQCKVGESDQWSLSLYVQSSFPLGEEEVGSALGQGKANMIICTLTGSTGSVELACLAIQPEESDSTQIYPLGIASAGTTVPSYTDKFRETKPHRSSSPGSVLDHTYDMARDASASCANLPESERCICVAQKKYDLCMKDAYRTAATCALYATLAAAVAYAACMAAFILIPGVNLLSAGGCLFWSVNALAAALLGCTHALVNASHNCIDNFMLDMEGCGWHWVWT